LISREGGYIIPTTVEFIEINLLFDHSYISQIQRPVARKLLPASNSRAVRSFNVILS
jgi:hypothetical protein